MEYCSTIPPLQQLAGALPPPPTVMVPVGVLKREGSSKQRSEGPKSVMFSDGKILQYTTDHSQQSLQQQFHTHTVIFYILCFTPSFFFFSFGFILLFDTPQNSTYYLNPSKF